MKDMKNLIYIIAVVLCMLTIGACRKEMRQDRFEFYGDITPDLYRMVRCQVVDTFGEPDTSMIYEYPLCYDSKGRPILPLHNRYLNHFEMMFSLSIWHDIDSSGEDLRVYYEMSYTAVEKKDDIVFWAIRCAPEEVDSVLSLYTAE